MPAANDGPAVIPRFEGRSAAILAGGRSSRMGTNKAVLDVGGAAIIGRTAALLRPLVADLFVVADDAAPFAALGIPVIPDLHPGCGPLGGIHAALCRARHPLVLCVACDMPFLDARLVELLLATAGTDADALVPRLPGGPEPLLAVYGRALVPVLERAIAAGRLRITEALEGERVRYLEVGEIDRIDPERRSFVNVNTPAELAEARASADRRVPNVQDTAVPGGRILGLDPGTKRIGVAVSDELLLAAHGLENIPAQPLSRAVDAVKKLIKDYTIHEIAVGLPVNMNGTLGAGAEKAQGFARRLEELLPGAVHLVDERMTTVVAERTLLEADLSRQKRRGLRDKLAAILILQSHLDARRHAPGG